MELSGGREIHTLIGAVVPMTRMAGRLENLESWLNIAVENNIGIVIVHDIQDEKTSPEIHKLVQSLNSSLILLVEGNYGSPGITRNAGLQLLDADYVYFWDSDDVPQIHNLPKIEPIFVKQDHDIVIGDFEIANWDPINKKWLTHKPTHLVNDIASFANEIGLWRCGIRKNSIQKNFTDLLMAEDQIFVAENISNWKIAFVPDLIYRYYKGDPMQLTKNKSAMDDLLIASRISMTLLKKSEVRLNKFYIILIFRQSMSAIKHGKLLVKVRSALQFILMTPYLVRGYLKINRNGLILPK